MSLGFISDVTAKQLSYKELLKAVNGGFLPAAASGVSASGRAAVISALSRDLKQPILAVCDSEGAANALYEDLLSLSASAVLFPARENELAFSVASSKEYEYNRLNTLSALADGALSVICMSAEAASEITVPREILKKNTFSLKTGDTLEIAELASRLVSAGYSRCETVEGKGQFAVRGGIVDIFSTANLAPCRIEFWGDEIDSIAFFDTESQRRGDTVEKLDIAQASEVVCEGDALAELLEEYLKQNKRLGEARKKTVTEDIAALKGGAHIPISRYMPLIYPAATIFDYQKNATVIIVEGRDVAERLKVLAARRNEDLLSLTEKGFVSSGCDRFWLSGDEFYEKCDRAVYLDSFARGRYENDIKSTVSFNFKRSTAWGGSLDVLIEDIQYQAQNGGSVVVLSSESKGGKILAEDICARGISAVYVDEVKLPLAKGVTVTAGGLSGGFEWPDLKFQLITRKGALTTAKRERKQSKNANKIGSLDELHNGDCVVHAAHGIGVFCGINSITNGGITKDYIKIRYAGQDVLYVPVTQLDLVSRYIGADSERVHLHKLGGTEWKNTRSRVKKAVKDMADQLTALYAKRMSVKGYAFSPDSDLINDFERRFPYEETADQIRCVDEIKGDMERAVPMDRLLCGDVGFGKTEVALRAAFKCICEGKQCAILVPTTILAWQHYNTAVSRIGELPVTVELLSRFVTPKRQERIIKELSRGNVDIVIGTHRLISKDIRFKDLGLVIIDEEQRFGVAQKERLKELYPAVDVLTLSATPIPRTLNMAMTGLRDMSSLDEAPGDRHPVQTYVLEQNNGVLIDAINKELRRGGQVYYLHNRVEDIERVAARIKKAIPDAAVGVAHGKMGEEQLSAIWKQLIEREIDVLVCTTIIETGVDVHNVNTLIIEDADRFGLSQLHQLRGRVGRSSRRAYAYFCFRPNKSLNEDALKRLDAIRQFTEFGSGFKIAMRDLEIRGAGSVLGGAQHGNMEAVGYDMYIKLLGEAMREQQGEIVTEEPACTVDLNINAHIPPKYIESLPSRLGIYKRIADIRSEEDKLDVIDELCDRFGEPPSSVMGLIEIALLRAKAAEAGIYEISKRGEFVVLKTGGNSAELFLKLTAAFGNKIKINREGNEITYALTKGQRLTAALSEITKAV